MRWDEKKYLIYVAIEIVEICEFSIYRCLSIKSERNFKVRQFLVHQQKLPFWTTGSVLRILTWWFFSLFLRQIANCYLNKHCKMWLWFRFSDKEVDAGFMLPIERLMRKFPKLSPSKPPISNASPLIMSIQILWIYHWPFRYLSSLWIAGR